MFIEFVTALLLFYVFFCFLGHEAYRILAPQPGIKSASPAFKGKVFTTAPPGMSLHFFFFSFSFIFISWRLISLQYCSGFCHTLAWISHGFICVPHPNPPSHLPLHPIPLVFPVHQAQALVSCLRPGLVICCTLDNIHVSMLFSRNIPPSPPPTESEMIANEATDKGLISKIYKQLLQLNSSISDKDVSYTGVGSHPNNLVCSCVLSCFNSVQLCVTLWMVACQAPLSMGILQAKILEVVAMLLSRESSQPRYRTRVSCISCIGRRVLDH